MSSFILKLFPILLISLIINAKGWAVITVEEVRDNLSLSKVSVTPRIEKYRPQASEILNLPFFSIPVSDEDLRFSVVPVYKNDRRGAKIRGTSFIVADSREDGLLNHTNYFPFNFQYKPSAQKSPLLYLVSNAHVLDLNPSVAITKYTLEFHYVKRQNPSALRLPSDFKVARISIPRADFTAIEKHPDVNGEEVDLVLFPLNHLFDAASQDPQLAGYTPVFTVFDNFLYQGSGEAGTKVWMYGFPEGEADRALSLPMRTTGTCSTDPKNLRCDSLAFAGSPQKSIIDFKMDITDIGGSSGSPIGTKNPVDKKSNMLLGVNFGGNDGDTIGYGIHSSRLRDFLIAKTNLIRQAANFHVISMGVAPLGSAAAQPIVLDPNITMAHPQTLIVRFNRDTDFDLTVEDIVQNLVRGPAILNLSDNPYYLLDQQVKSLLERVAAEGLLNNIVILRVSNNRLTDFSNFSGLLAQQNFRFLDINSSFQNERDIYQRLSDAERLKVVSAPKYADFRAIQRAGIQLSPEAHTQYYLIHED